MSEDNAKRQRMQRIGLIAVAAVGVLAAGTWIFSSDNSASNADRAEDLRKRRAMTDVINPPSLGNDFLAETGTRITSLEDSVRRLEEVTRSLGDAVTERDRELAATRTELDKAQRDALAMVEDMAGRVAQAEIGATQSSDLLPSGTGLRPTIPASDPFLQRGVVPGTVDVPGTAVTTPLPPPDPRKVEIITFEPVAASLETGVLQPAVFHTRDGDYVPPNAYAQARVLVGVDMSTGVRLSADPKPVLLRITGPAYSVIEGGLRLDVDLEGCLVNGAAHAELSSERVFVKLQKITCDRGDGVVAESPVEGYIAQLGKVGVRGRVVSREGDIVSKALVAGVVGGFGRGLSRNTDQIFAAGSGGATTIIGNESLSAGDIAAGGLGEGLSTAADTVAEYLIERAEQYQPVIEMPTGIDVEIVFLSGFYARGTNQ
ncbi:MAG: TraB/VirB10 family protein [Pseudomonadota bacterium]